MVFFPEKVSGTFVWFCFSTPLIQVIGGGGGGGGGGCLDLVAARESQAMLNTMEDLLSSTGNAQVDAFVDNNVLLAC